MGLMSTQVRGGGEVRDSGASTEGEFGEDG